MTQAPYEIQWEKHGVLVSFHGTVDAEDNTNADIELIDDPRFDGVQYIIWDLSNVSELLMTKEEVTLASTQDKLAAARLPQLKLALLAKDKQIRRQCEYYVAVSYNHLPSWTIKVYDSMDRVRSWLAE